MIIQKKINTKLNLNKDDEDESDSIGHSFAKMKDIYLKDKISPPYPLRIYSTRPVHRSFF
jgi:hypothetical protein